MFQIIIEKLKVFYQSCASLNYEVCLSKQGACEVAREPDLRGKVLGHCPSRALHQEELLEVA